MKASDLPKEPYRVLSVWVRVSLAEKFKQRAGENGLTLRQATEDAIDLWLHQANVNGD